MRIANPLYDVIFKYLMENTEIAKDLLSAILGEKISTLELKPQDLIGQTQGGVRVSRMDFKAVIKKADGALKTVLIELEKNKRGFEIPRFRRYLGLNYSKETMVTTSEGVSEAADLPITLIYFLGYELNKDIFAPILKVERVYKDVVTNAIFAIEDDFVEALSHDLYIIQIPKLTMAAQTELEELLDVFNVKKYKTNDNHVLEYTGASTNPKLRRILKHLNQATEIDTIVETMKMEDEFDFILNTEKAAVEAAIRQKEAAIRQKEAAIYEKEAANREKEAANREKEAANQRAEMLQLEAEASAKEIEYLRQQLAAAIKDKK